MKCVAFINFAAFVILCTIVWENLERFDSREKFADF